MTYLYRRSFNLTDAVKDYVEANEYLAKDDMTKYLKEDVRIPEEVRNAVTNIKWFLFDKTSGYIEVNTSEKLDDSQLEYIQDFIEGQNSDGLVSGFSNQPFANYIDEGLSGYAGSNWDDEQIVVGFVSSNDKLYLVNSY